jgi:outer membrane cobalamin receptor
VFLKYSFVQSDIFFISLLCIFANNVFAQSNVKPDSLRHTTAPPITITSDAENSEILMHPTDIHVVSSEELLIQTSATRLSDAIQVLHPSLDIRNYGSLGGISLASFRGLPTEYTTLYWEGIRITNSQNSLSDLSLINISAIQSVGIISAANAQLIGGDIGAGILLHSNPSEKPAGFDIGSSLLSYDNISSFGEKQLDFGGVYKVTDSFSIAGGLSNTYSNGAFPFLQPTGNSTAPFVNVYRENNDAHLLNANLGGEYKIDDNANIKAI